MPAGGSAHAGRGLAVRGDRHGAPRRLCRPASAGQPRGNPQGPDQEEFAMRRLMRFVDLVSIGLRATLFYALSLVWAKGLSLLTLPLLTRMLTPAQFGRLELLSSAAEIGGLIAGAWLVDTLFRFASGPGDAGRP